MGRSCRRMEERRSCFEILTGKSTKKRPLGRPKHIWEEDIRMDLKEIGNNMRNWVDSISEWFVLLLPLSLPFKRDDNRDYVNHLRWLELVKQQELSYYFDILLCINDEGKFYMCRNINQCCLEQNFSQGEYFCLAKSVIERLFGDLRSSPGLSRIFLFQLCK